MGTMNGMQRPSLSEEAVARLIDPRTGQRLRPLGVVGGRAIYPMMGASPDDPADSEKREGTDGKDKDSEGEESESKDSDEGGDGEDSKSKANPTAKIEDLEEEKERHYRRRKEAEEKASKLERELAELKAKDTPEQEKLQQRVTELESTLSATEDSLKSAHLENAFLKDNTFTWHNPGRALKLADLEKVEIDGDGKVHGLKDALDKLAKSDPYLIKKEESGKDKKDPPNTGDPKNPSKKERVDESKDTERAKLLQKYPALRR